MEEIRECSNCEYFDEVCNGLWKGRKVTPRNTCVGHSEGDDHLQEKIKPHSLRMFTEAQIKEIQELYKEGVTTKELATKYGVRYDTVYNYVSDLTPYKKILKENIHEQEIKEIMKLMSSE